MPLFHYKSALHLFFLLSKKGKPPSSVNKLTYDRPVVAMTRIRFLRGATLLLLRPQSLAVPFWGIFELIINESGGTRCTRSYHSPALLACLQLSRLSLVLVPHKVLGKPVGEAGCDKRLLHPVSEKAIYQYLKGARGRDHFRIWPNSKDIPQNSVGILGS